MEADEGGKARMGSPAAPGCSPHHTRGLWQPSLPRAPLPALMQRCVGAAGSYGDGGLSQLDLRPLSSFILETNAGRRATFLPISIYWAVAQHVTRSSSA